MRAIKNIQNLSLSELFVELMNNSNEEIYFTDLDTYNHIKYNTDNFDMTLLTFFYYDLFSFVAFELCYLINGDKYIYPLISLQDLDYEPFGDPVYKDMPKLNTNNVEKIVVENVIDELVLRAKQLIDDNNLRVKFDNDYAFSYILKYAHLFSAVLRKHNFDYEGYRDAQYSELIKDKRNAQISVIKFIDLFKTEYQNKIDRFKSWLKREEYINDTHEITASNYTNFARLFYLLRDNSIIKPNINNTKGITAYFKEFGVNVVETLNSLSETPEIARKTVTNENAKDFTQLGMTQKEKNTLLNLFKNN